MAEVPERLNKLQIDLLSASRTPRGDSRRAQRSFEPSTWAMMLLGFAGLGFAGYRRRTRRT
jgi:hypothetical protein